VERQSRRAVLGVLTVVTWVPVALLADRDATLARQHLIALLTWALLFIALWKSSPLLRTQILLVVSFATMVEYLFAGHFGVYVYRLENVPWFVPPGHGLIYFGAYSLGLLLKSRQRFWSFVLVGLLALWVLWGLFLSPQLDVLGAFWFINLLIFLKWGPSQSTYLGAIVVVSWLEIVGTSIGTWKWMEYDTIKEWVAQGNPPSGAAGGYGWFDLFALLLAPILLRQVRKLRTRNRLRGELQPLKPEAHEVAHGNRPDESPESHGSAQN